MVEHFKVIFSINQPPGQAQGPAPTMGDLYNLIHVVVDEDKH
jgi:hypothetical protein